MGASSPVFDNTLIKKNAGARRGGDGSTHRLSALHPGYP